MRISNLDEQILELDENIKDREKQIQERDEQNKALGDVEDDEDSKDKDVLKKVKAELKKLKKRRHFRFTAHRDVCAYPEEFTPGKATPRLVRNITDKWFTEQFAKGKPVGSIVRLAWFADVFHSFWEQHQSAYLALDPGLEKLQRHYSEKGKRGATIKADEKWRRFAALFVDYVTSTAGTKSKTSPTETKEVVDAFGEYLIDQKVIGATDRRTVEPIKEFLASLMSNMDRAGNGGDSHTILTLLRANTGSHRRDGRFRRSSFTSLSVDTVEACLETLRAVLMRDRTGHAKKKGQRPKRQR